MYGQLIQGTRACTCGRRHPPQNKAILLQPGAYLLLDPQVQAQTLKYSKASLEVHNKPCTTIGMKVYYEPKNHSKFKETNHLWDLPPNLNRWRSTNIFKWFFPRTKKWCNLQLLNKFLYMIVEVAHKPIGYLHTSCHVLAINHELGYEVKNFLLINHFSWHFSGSRRWLTSFFGFLFVCILRTTTNINIVIGWCRNVFHHNSIMVIPCVHGVIELAGMPRLTWNWVCLLVILVSLERVVELVFTSLGCFFEIGTQTQKPVVKFQPHVHTWSRICKKS